MQTQAMSCKVDLAVSKQLLCQIKINNSFCKITAKHLALVCSYGLMSIYGCMYRLWGRKILTEVAHEELYHHANLNKQHMIWEGIQKHEGSYIGSIKYHMVDGFFICFIV
uniref:Uncharacterized protein n=1 Tax=Micrurus spixii TaxID=129469 RepID=A0A2D4LEI6_9SAUR